MRFGFVNLLYLLLSGRSGAAVLVAGLTRLSGYRRLNSWLPVKAQDAITHPKKLREADEQVAEFKEAMNASRAATGARLLFPRASSSFLIRDHSAFLPILNETPKLSRLPSGCPDAS